MKRIWLLDLYDLKENKNYFIFSCVLNRLDFGQFILNVKKLVVLSRFTWIKFNSKICNILFISFC